MREPKQSAKGEYLISILILLAIPLLVPAVFLLIMLSDWSVKWQSEERI